MEVRHSSWDQKPFYDYLEDQSVGIVVVDQPVIGQSLAMKPLRTGPVGYVRLHGRNDDHWFSNNQNLAKKNPSTRYDYYYSQKEISEIADITKKVAQNATETYVIQNNHPNGQAIANATQLLAELEQKVPRLPNSLIQAFPDLKEFSMPF